MEQKKIQLGIVSLLIVAISLGSVISGSDGASLSSPSSSVVVKVPTREITPEEGKEGSDNKVLSQSTQRSGADLPARDVSSSSSSSSSSGLDETLLPPSSSAVEVNSPLHVAQCRATCIQKFNNRFPALLAFSCFTHSDCFTCWKSCEVLEPLAKWTSSQKGAGDDDKVAKTKRSKSALASMCLPSRPCLSGCQVACGFFESLLLKMSNEPESLVVATKRANVLQISSGKMAWPQEEEMKSMKNKNNNHQIPLVYVLIQEYPDLKWRQITQTTDTSVEISKSLSSQMPHKLRNVRVLVVSPNGLVAIYYPNANYNDKNEETTTTRTTTTTTTTSTPSSTASPPSSSLSKDSPTFEELDLSSRMLQVDDERGNKDNDMNNNNHRPGHDHDDEQVKVEVEQAEEDTWELRKVSLIHQKSLVIAELTWNPVKVSEDQEYLITWELDGGGLKGHLVTDSTSVSLSLWPDTLYHIQVELFEREEEDGEGGEEEQQGPGEESSSSSKSKSLPVTVDTSEASYPLLEKPSALSEDSNGPPGHKSVMEFLNVTLLLTLSSAVLLVLGSLLVGLSCHNILVARRRLLASKRGEGGLLQDTDDSETFSDNNKVFSQSLSSNSDSSTVPVRGSSCVAIISSPGLVYPSEKVEHQNQQQQLQQQQQQHLQKQMQQDCWWQNLSTTREHNHHYHINNSSSSTATREGMYLTSNSLNLS